MAHRLAPEAEADLDATWFYIARESGSPDIADRLVDSITGRFLMLATHPHIGRSRAEDLRAGLRSFAVGAFVIVYRVEDLCHVPALAVKAKKANGASQNTISVRDYTPP